MQTLLLIVISFLIPIGAAIITTYITNLQDKQYQRIAEPYYHHKPYRQEHVMPNNVNASQLELAKTLDGLLTLSPEEFEKLIAWLLVQWGGKHVHLVGKSGDLGADITFFDRKGRYIVVQCKRYNPKLPIGSPAIQTFIGMIYTHHSAEKGIFVTTSVFSKPAIELAAKHNIMLIDGPRLVKLLKVQYENMPENTR